MKKLVILASLVALLLCVSACDQAKKEFDKAKREAEHATEQAKKSIDEVSDEAQKQMDAVKDTVEEIAESEELQQVKEAAQEVGEKIEAGARELQDKATDK